MENERFLDFYELLGVSYESTFDEIKAAYRRMAKRYHPDLNPEDVEGATQRFRIINDAWNILSDPSKRRHYDREWQRARNFEEPPEPTGRIDPVSDEDWLFACYYFRNLQAISDRLRKISESLEIGWRNSLFFFKNFSEAESLASSFEEAYLAKMVGHSEVLRMVARDALLASQKKLLSELVTALRVLGTDATESCIEKICRRSVEYTEKSAQWIEIRSEKIGDYHIEIRDDLWCRIWRYDRTYNKHYDESWFPYVFTARDAAVNDRVFKGGRKKS